MIGRLVLSGAWAALGYVWGEHVALHGKRAQRRGEVVAERVDDAFSAGLRMTDLADLAAGVDPMPNPMTETAARIDAEHDAQMERERAMFSEPDDVTEDGVSRIYPGRAGG